MRIFAAGACTTTGDPNQITSLEKVFDSGKIAHAWSVTLKALRQEWRGGSWHTCTPVWSNVPDPPITLEIFYLMFGRPQVSVIIETRY